MHSISLKLWGALLLVVLLSVGLMAYLANLTTGREFSQYLSRGNAIYTQNIVNELNSYYSNQQSWTGVQSIITALRRGTVDRLVITDASDRIVADTESQWSGQSASSEGLVNGTSIEVGGHHVGTVYILNFSGGMGSGMMGRGYMGGMAGTDTPTMMGDAEEGFLSQINTSLLISGLIAVVVALGLGLILTRQITKPVMSLNYGAQQIAQGNLNYRVRTKSKDELGKLSESFNIMAINLDKGEQERQRIIADIAHELRTPLTVIDGTVDAITDGVFKPDKERLGSIKEQTQLLAHLISDLRDLSLAESGQLRLELVPTDIVELVRRKLTQVEIKTHEKNINLKFVASDRVPKVMIDPSRIEQVISNLMANAIRHTPHNGSITISIKSTEFEPVHRLEKQGVLISISDTGEGIPPDHLSHIFERFYRVEESRSREEGGVGLGLAIVKQLIQAHGGKVWVESEVGKGTIFYVAL